MDDVLGLVPGYLVLFPVWITILPFAIPSSYLYPALEKERVTFSHADTDVPWEMLSQTDSLDEFLHPS